MVLKRFGTKLYETEGEVNFLFNIVLLCGHVLNNSTQLMLLLSLLLLLPLLRIGATENATASLGP